MGPDKVMEGISLEILATLKAMKKAKTAEEKLIYSQTVKNLSKSLGVFLNFMSDMDLYNEDDMYDDDDDVAIPF